MNQNTIRIIALTSRLNEQPGSLRLMKPQLLRALVRALAEDSVSQDELNRLAHEQRLYNQMLQQEQARGPAVQIVDDAGVESWNPQFANQLNRQSPVLYRRLIAQRQERRS